MTMIGGGERVDDGQRAVAGWCVRMSRLVGGRFKRHGTVGLAADDDLLPGRTAAARRRRSAVLLGLTVS